MSAFLFLNLISKLVPLTPETAMTLNYVYPAAGHVITDNLKIISDSRIRSIIARVLNIALKDYKLNIFKIIDRRISFYSQNTNMLPLKPKISYRYL